MLNTVASIADQNPTAFVDGEICVVIVNRSHGSVVIEFAPLVRELLAR
jgi:hypothetical protein